LQRTGNAKQPDGNFISPVQVMRSADGGLTFSDPVVAANMVLPCNRYAGVASIPFLAADTSHGPFNDRAYIAWSDVALDTPTSSSFTQTIRAKRGRNRWWSTILQQPAKGLALQTAISLLIRSGIVGIAWYDSREFRSARREDGFALPRRLTAANRLRTALSCRPLHRGSIQDTL